MTDLNHDREVTDLPEQDRRKVTDRRSGVDRRGEVRYENDRRNNHGRRSSDKDPWKDALKD